MTARLDGDESGTDSRQADALTRRWGTLTPPRVEQSDRRFSSVSDFELSHDVRHVMLDRLVSDVELERDALVAEPRRHQSQDLLLAIVKRCDRRALGQLTI